MGNPAAEPVGVKPDGVLALRWPRSVVVPVVIAAVALLCGGVLWGTAHYARRSALARLRSRGNHDLQLYLANIRRELDRYRYLPRLLAADRRVRNLMQHPDNPRDQAVLDHYLHFVAQDSGASVIYVMAHNGLTRASSNWNQPDSFVGHNYSFRPYFRQAMKGHLGQYYALGTESGRRGYYFAYPVDSAGSAVGAVVVKVPLASLEATQGGSHVQFLVTGPHGIIFLSTNPAWRYHALHALKPAVRRRIRSSRRYAGRALPSMPVASRKALGAESALLRIREHGHSVSYLANNVTMPGIGWTVYILSNTASVSPYVTHTVLLAGFMLGALILAVFLILQRRARLAERIRLEHAARESAAAGEARVRAIIDNARAGLVTLDGRGRIEFFNPTAQALLGISAEQATGREFSALLEADAGERFRALLTRSARDAESPPTLELSLTRSSTEGRLPLEAAVNTMLLPDGWRAIVTLHDLTERKQHEAALQRTHEELEHRVAERTGDLLETNRRLVREIAEHRRTEDELRRTRDELVQAAKLAAIGQLAAGINHELNQPLTAIRFYADNAKAFLERSRLDSVGDNLEQIAGLTDRMGRIIHQLKVFARKSSGLRTAVSVKSILEGVSALLSPRLRRERVAVRTALPEHDVFCLGDLVRLEQVFVNLVGNAAHAMKDMADASVDIAVSHDGGQVQVSVRDHGPGVPGEHLSHIFDPFFTTKQSGEGLGLGLSISARIVEELGGTIRAVNHPEGGAEFTVTLPEATSPEPERVHD